MDKPQYWTALRWSMPIRVRIEIVTEAYMREMSPKVFFDEFGGGSLSRVSQHFEKLAAGEWLWLERTETGGRRRGGVEHFYRAKELVIFEDEAWAVYLRP